MEGQVVDFLTFCEDYLMQGEGGKAANGGVRMNRPATEKIGALLQVFEDETGACRAVVNGLFPGGGKLFARWLHLFPGETIEHLKLWIGHVDGGQFYFPWQGWSNANFQPSLSKNNLAVPGGRTLHLQGGKRVLLGDLTVLFDATGFQLIDKETNEPVLLNDLGLESPESRPPAMQVLWHLGVPYVSLEALLPPRTWKEGGPGWHYAERKTFGALILERKTWQIDVEKFTQWLSNKKEYALFSEIRTAILAMGINRRFFARFIREKPQYFDLDSPLSVQLFAKMLTRRQTPLFVTEMLPLPEQCIVQKNGLRAAEFVFEFEV